MSKKHKSANKQDYQSAMGRLEDAVKDLGEAAKGNFAERAAEVLEQTAARLKSEMADTGDKAAASTERSESADDDQWAYNKSATGRLRHWHGDRAARPFRDLDNARLWGICAGFAPYLGLEIWVVRCLAITALLFMPQVIVPAYLIAYFVLDAYSELDELGVRPSRRAKRRMRQRERSEARADRREQKRADKREQKRGRKSSSPDAPRPAAARKTEPTAPPAVPARSVLRHAKATINEAELRLRRMEGHVTSGRYELQRELRKIES